MTATQIHAGYRVSPDGIEGKWLAACAADGAAVGDLAEIGSYAGAGSTQVLGRVAVGRGRVLYCIDTFWNPRRDADGWKHQDESVAVGAVFGEFVKNVTDAGLWSAVRVLRMPSIEAATMVDEDLGFCLIDGDHWAPGVTDDFAYWTGKVAVGGILAAHDVEQHDIPQAVERFMTPDLWDDLGRKRQLQCWRRKP